MSVVQVPLSSMQRHIAGAVRRGWSLESLFSRSLIQFGDGEGRGFISPAQCLLLCMNTVLEADDATHGLARKGVAASYPAIGLRMALGCSSLEGAIGVLGRLYAAASDAVHIKLQTEGDAAILSVHMDAAEDQDAAYLEENFLVWIFMQCLFFIGRAPSIMGVTLRDAAHFSIGRLHWALGGSVRYGEVTAIRFPRKLLGHPPASRADGEVMWDCHKLWLDYVEAGTSAASPTDYVTGSGFVRFADIVRQAGKSPNTVRRHFIQASNELFRDARRRALVAAALDRLCESECSVEAVAADLGYSDASSLRRFLKSATGLTPQQLRERRRAEEPKEERRVLDELQAFSARMDL